MSSDLIFLSYAREDAARVRAVHARLRRDGFRLWLDENNLLPGQDWDTAIRKAICTSKVFAVFLSENAVTKTGYIQKEIREALRVTELQPEGQVFILPVRLTDCVVPESLRKWQWVDLFSRHGYDQLLRGLATHLGIDVRANPVSKRACGRTFASSTDYLLFDLFLESDRLLHAAIARRPLRVGPRSFLCHSARLSETISHPKTTDCRLSRDQGRGGDASVTARGAVASP
ncbi:MAG: toll/interleukin-1 receptor domain-containing protein [Acidobacteria bacterium]|nr:toll/interleukin-1 receptor domain-containing protein [Acidobacteriota bacterium]